MSDPERRRPRGLAALLSFMGFGEDEPEVSTPTSEAAAALREQAEAFQTVTVGEVMTPRADIRAVDLESTFEELVTAFVESEHSRLPVYRETLDDPIGFVHLRDVFQRLADPARPRGELSSLVRQTLFVPASMRAADLLVRMQGNRAHLALVIDEFGGVDGLVTLEDLIEAVVGDIDDEHDEDDAPPILTRPGGVLEVAGRTPLEELEAALDRKLVPDDLEDEEIDTAAGLVTALAGRVPQRGEMIAHPDGALVFEIADADPRRIKRLRVRPATTDA